MVVCPHWSQTEAQRAVGHGRTFLEPSAAVSSVSVHGRRRAGNGEGTDIPECHDGWLVVVIQPSVVRVAPQIINVYRGINSTKEDLQLLLVEHPVHYIRAQRQQSAQSSARKGGRNRMGRRARTSTTSDQ